MKIPKNIENAIEQRAKAAERFNYYDYIISKLIDNNGIDVDGGDTHGGVESIVNPWTSARKLKESIIEAGD